MHCLILGGGAAGFFAAITALEANPSLHVTVLEKNPRPLGKVRISGGGRCNVTTSITDPAQLVQHYPRGGRELRGPFTRFGPRDTMAWFEARGVQLKTEADGRVFPVTDDSATIVNCLLGAARGAGATVQTGAAIESVTKEGGEFVVQLRGGETLRGERLLLATGSNTQGYDWARSFGHTLTPLAPSLFTFNVRDPRLDGLAGVSAPEAEVRLGGWQQRGPVLVTHWGLSGPAVLKLSAWAARELAACHYRAELRLNWLPSFNEDRLREAWARAKAEHPNRAVAGSAPVPLPQRLWERLARAAGVPASRRWAALSKTEAAALIDQILRGRFTISGKGVFKEEFVTCGGVDLREVNFKTMESRVCAGLFLAGEILDLDGLTGGFNFQSAWTTGWLAGLAMAKT